LDDGVNGRDDLGCALRPVETLDRFDGVTVLADAQAVTDDLVEVNEHPVSKKLIHLVLTGVVARAQPPDGADLVGGVMVDVQAGIVLPPVEYPVHEAFECELFLVTVVRPPVLEVE